MVICCAAQATFDTRCSGEREIHIEIAGSAVSFPRHGARRRGRCWRRSGRSRDIEHNAAGRVNRVSVEVHITYFRNARTNGSGAQDVRPGGAFGASATTGPDSPGVDENELAAARALGKRVAEFAAMIKRGSKA